MTMNDTNDERPAVSCAALFAFTVSDKDRNAPCIVTFAKNRSDAKRLALTSEWYACDDIEWTELRVKREPTLDELARRRGRGRLGDTDEDIRIMREMGWYQYEGSSWACDECGLCVWEGLPESYLDENEVCGECRAKMANAKLSYPSPKQP
jgi:hypothetical protein